MRKTLEKIVQWVLLPAAVGVGVYLLSRPATENCVEKIKSEFKAEELAEGYLNEPEKLEKFDGLADYIKEQEIMGLEKFYGEIPVPKGLVGPEEVRLNYTITGDHRLVTLTYENGENYLIRADTFLDEGSLSLLKSKRVDELMEGARPIVLQPKISYKTESIESKPEEKQEE